MKNLPMAQLRRLGVGAAVGAMVMSTVALTSPAHAADLVTVTSNDIAPDATIYAGWHQGVANGMHAVTSQGLKLVDKSQVIYGFADNGNAGLAADGVNADLSEDLIGATYDIKNGNAWFQVPVFIDTDNDDSTDGVFATLRPNKPETEVTDGIITGDEEWTSSKSFGTVVAHATMPLDELITAVEAHKYKTIAFGVFTDPGYSATVSSIGFKGTTYNFKSTPQTESVTVTNADIRDEETSSNYRFWHQGFDDATALHQVTANGLELAGKSQVIKGYNNNSDKLTVRNADLFTVLDDASITTTAGQGWFQIPMFFTDGGATTFTTLRTSVNGAGAHSLADRNWISTKAIGSVPAHTSTPLSTILAEMDNYKVIAFGALNDADQSTIVSNITFDGVSYDFADAAAAAASELVVAAAIAPNADVYQGWHQGATGGVATVGNDGLALGVAKSQIIRGYADNAHNLRNSNVDLAEALRTMSYTVTSGQAHFQVEMFFENATTGAREFTTLRPTAPATTGTHTASLGDKWTSSKAIDGVLGANGSAKLGDILSAVTTYKVIAFGVFSDPGVNAVVKDITWDGTKYSFGSATSKLTVKASSSKPTTGTTLKVNATIDVVGNAPAASVEGDTVTVKNGSRTLATGTVASGKVSLTVGKLLAGRQNLVVSFAGNDSVNAGTVTLRVNVAKAATKVSAKPTSKKVTAKKAAKISVSVSASGVTINGGTVTIKEGKKTLGKATVRNGKATVKLKKLKKGTHKLTVRFAGNSSANSSSKTIKVKVKKK